MQRVFADAGYWIGLFNDRDSLHPRAVAASRKFRPHQIVTSEMVLSELLNNFSERGLHFRQAAAIGVASLRGSSEVAIVPQTRAVCEGLPAISGDVGQGLEPHGLCEFHNHGRRGSNRRSESRPPFRPSRLPGAAALVIHSVPSMPSW